MTVSTRHRGLPRRQVAPDKSFTIVDLTGGLDLYRDGAQLESNFSYDMMNVDPLVGGGIKRRKGVSIYSSTALEAIPGSLSTYITAEGWQFVLTSLLGTIYQVRKSGLTPLTSGTRGPTLAPVWRTVQVYNKAYMYDSTYGFDWTRSFTCTRTGAANVVPIHPGFNATVPKYGVYLGGEMPICKAMAFWHGRVWGADTVELNVEYKNRIRWSFPIVNNLGAEDWHPDDYLTSDETGEAIHSLVPQGDRLLIFKAGSVDQITGWDETNFVRTTILHDAGAVSADAICELGGSVYFWDALLGLCRFTDAGFDMLSTRILPLVHKMSPKVTYDVVVDATGNFGPSNNLATQVVPQVYLGTVADRIWCSVVYADANNVTQRRALVFDPKLGPTRQSAAYDPRLNAATTRGGWLVYDLQLGPFVTSFRESWEPYGLDYLAASRDPNLPVRLLRLEIDNLDVDDFGTALRSIPSWYRTGWLADDIPFKRKRWRRVQAILEAGNAQSFGLEAYADWDGKSLKDSLTFNNPATVTNVFETNRSLMAPTVYEMKRPAGLAGPGANALYPVGASTGIATWDDAVTTWDSPDRDWEGNYYTPPAAGVSSDLYTPVTPLPVPCPGTSTYDHLGGASRTGYEFQNLNMPAARAVQFLVVGALPSKEWSLRGIMVTYREVEG